MCSGRGTRRYSIILLLAASAQLGNGAIIKPSDLSPKTLAVTFVERTAPPATVPTARSDELLRQKRFREPEVDGRCVPRGTPGGTAM